MAVNTPTKTPPMKLEDRYARIWAMVEKIPAGCVATYGQIAAEAGFGKQPRLAGNALFHLPKGSRTPWHRVINAQGRISFPVGSAAYRRQKRLLEAEGLTMIGSRFDLERYRWRPRREAPVLD